ITTNFCGATWYLDSLSGVSLNADTLFTPLVSSDTTFYLADNSCGIGGPRTAIQVSVNPLLNVSIVSTSSLICYEETATLTAFGANSYTWNNAANTSTSFINPVVTWNYTVTGIDSNNCVN